MNAIAADRQEHSAAIERQLRDAQSFACARFSSDVAMRFEEVAAHSNFNHLFSCRSGDERYFLKVALNSPKALSDALPRERILGEARAMNFYARHAAEMIDVPEVVAADPGTCALLMTDVGEGRRNLADVVRDDYALYARSIGEMACGIGRCHARSRGAAECADMPYMDALRRFAYRVLIRSGIHGVAGDCADEVLQKMQDARMCMIHSDLWAKNMLIGENGRMALLDFEGAMLGDPVFDLATMLAAATMPVFQYGIDPALWGIAWQQIVDGYADGIADPEWVCEMHDRLPQVLAVWLAARVAGPFPYSMSEQSGAAVAELALALLTHQAGGTEEMRVSVAQRMPRQVPL